MTFENLALWCTRAPEAGKAGDCITFEENVKNMRFVNLTHPHENETQSVSMFRFEQISDTDVIADGEAFRIGTGEVKVMDADRYGEIVINSHTELLSK